jgi:CRP/FNR family cyclic AMP-dependent transcriptional regulator
MLDIDPCRKVNDTHGHMAGDQVLRLVAQVLQDQTRFNDFVSRYGGEEFAFLLPGSTADQGRLVAEKTCLVYADWRIKVTLSAGGGEIDKDNHRTAEGTMAQQELSDCLQQCELFRGLSRQEVENIASLGSLKTYQAGENILSQGELGQNLYIIADGTVVLERSIDLATRRGRAVIGLLGKGRALGCWSTLLGEPHRLMSSARCRRSTRVVVLRGEALREMMLGDLELGFKVLERLCFILRDRIQSAFGAMENV